MSILTYLLNAEIKDMQTEFDAKTLTRPTLSYSDGKQLMYCVDLDVGQQNPLRSVPIASNSRDAFYADVGSAVRVRRSESGWFEVTGLSKRMPGTLVEVPVSIPKFKFSPLKVYSGPTPSASTGGVIVGTPQSIGLSSRSLTYGELATFGGYGTVPYGCIALYSGGTLLGINGF